LADEKITMPPTQPLPPKKEVALALLERSSVYVHLDPRQGPVVVPAWFKKQPQLVLQVGLNMPVPIKDLQLDDDGMSCTLSFSRSPFFCVVPWSSVFAIIGCDDGRGMVWPDDVPAEVARQAESRDKDGSARKEPPRAVPLSDASAEAPKAKRARKRPLLGAVPNAEVREASASKPARSGQGMASSRPAVSPAPGPRPAAPTRKRRELPPYLRVVK
jgi:stringent starvation protein B